MTTLPQQTQSSRILLKVGPDGTLYLTRGFWAGLGSYPQAATLYLDQYRNGHWQTALVNPYPLARLSHKKPPVLTDSVITLIISAYL